jgi:hypothetical protein
MAMILSLLLMTASMLVVGWLVWTRLQRQETEDPGYRQRLQADDDRAERELSGGVEMGNGTRDEPRGPARGESRESRRR